MKIIVHDLSQQEFASLYTANATDTIISDNGSIHHCIGCFGCWIKTPGVCVLKDGYQNIGELKGINLSTRDIEEITVSETFMELRGAKIDQIQALSLVQALGVEFV